MAETLTERTVALARKPQAEWALAIVAFVESSFFPVPPDVLLAPVALARPGKWLRLAIVCTGASVIGALAGYAIGVFLFDLVAEPILEFYALGEAFDRLARWYAQWGAWGVLFAALTPFPYKVVAIFSGFAGFDLIAFIAASVVGRGIRFLAVAWLSARFGEAALDFALRKMGWGFAILLLILLGGFLLIGS